MQLALQISCLSATHSALARKRTGTDHRLMAAGTGAAKTCIVGLGDPIVDVLVKLSAQNFDQLGLERGGSVSLHMSEVDDLLGQVADDGHRTRLLNNGRASRKFTEQLTFTPRLVCAVCTEAVLQTC